MARLFLSRSDPGNDARQEQTRLVRPRVFIVRPLSITRPRAIYSTRSQCKEEAVLLLVCPLNGVEALQVLIAEGDEERENSGSVQLVFSIPTAGGYVREAKKLWGARPSSLLRARCF